MVVFKSSRRRHHLISYNRDHKFRFGITVFPNRYGNDVFLTTFNNSYLLYTLVSNPVPNGTYKLKITEVDAFLNENTGVQGTVVVSFYPLPPQNVILSLNGNLVTLSWTTSADGNPDNYVIYSNNGDGSTGIDRGHSIAVIAGNLNQYSFTVPNGNWSFVVESKKNGIQSVTMNKVQVVIPVTATIPPKPGPSGSSPLALTGLNLYGVSVGAVNISFLWLYGAQADTFYVYHDNGTGIIDYTAPKFTFPVQSQLIQSYTTPQLLFVEGPVTFKFAVRSVLNGVVDGNTDEYTIDVDGTAPPNSQSLVLDTIF